MEWNGDTPSDIHGAAPTSTQRRLKKAKFGCSRPPIPSTMAGERRKGPQGTGFGSRPRMKPKSMCSRWPSGQSMMFCMCLSPMPVACIRKASHDVMRIR